MKATRILITGFAILVCWSGSVLADYTIVLKNNRSITVKNYWEENGMVKFHVLGGEIGIGKRQILSIVPASEAERPGIVIAHFKPSLIPEARVNDLASEQEVKPTSPKIKRFIVEDQEEKEYQTMYEEVEKQIKLRTDLYWLITRGTNSPDPTILRNWEALKGRHIDLKRWMRDSEHRPPPSRGTGVVNLEVNSPFAGRRIIIGLRHEGKIRPDRVVVPPRKVNFNNPGRARGAAIGSAQAVVDVPVQRYTIREKELSELRNQLNDLYEQRKRLIQQMKDKGMFSGSLPNVPRKFLE